jgi:hypothetical protein
MPFDQKSLPPRSTMTLVGRVARPQEGLRQAPALRGAHRAVVELETQETDTRRLFVGNVLPGRPGCLPVTCQRQFRQSSRLGKGQRGGQLDAAWRLTWPIHTAPSGVARQIAVSRQPSRLPGSPFSALPPARHRTNGRAGRTTRRRHREIRRRHSAWRERGRWSVCQSMVRSLLFHQLMRFAPLRAAAENFRPRHALTAFSNDGPNGSFGHLIAVH